MKNDLIGIVLMTSVVLFGQTTFCATDIQWARETFRQHENAKNLTDLMNSVRLIPDYNDCSRTTIFFYERDISK